MIYKTDYGEVYKDLLRYNENKGTMSVSMVAEYLDMDPDKASSDILKNCPYLDGRTHRYHISVVARAICDNMVYKKTVDDDTPLRLIP